MPARFLHTADWQIGKPFEYIADEAKSALVRQERIAMIPRIGAVAQAHGAEFILVAGDLFDSNTPAKADISAACAAIGALGLPVYVIPGNHDHGGPGTVWEQPFFLREQAALAPNLHPLLQAAPVELASALILPCPLLRRHESADTTAWVRAVDFSAPALADKPRLVLAHGSVQDFHGSGNSIDGSQEEEDNSGTSANFLDLARLPTGQLDYLALGDWHGMKQVSTHAWYAGTPEQDRFAKGVENAPGQVLAVTVERGAAPQVQAVRTARLGWHRLAHDLTDDTALPPLFQALDSLLGQRAGQDLLRLELTGRLGITAMTGLEQHQEALEARLMHLRLRGQVAISPAAEEISALTQRTGDPLIARVAARLVEESRAGGEAAETALTALRELHAALAAA